MNKFEDVITKHIKIDTNSKLWELEQLCKEVYNQAIDDCIKNAKVTTKELPQIKQKEYFTEGVYPINRSSTFIIDEDSLQNLKINEN
jgi:hypothetical protein